MYYENTNKLINIWRDGDIIHVFITALSQKKYQKCKNTLDYVKKILCMNIEDEYDGTQIYFQLGDFDELNEFREYFYKYLSQF